MQLSRDERRALAFVGLLIALAALARAVDRPAAPVLADAPPADVEALAAASDSAAADAERRSRPLEPGERIDPNTAPAAELDRLPGVGPALADRIIASRAREGPFHSVPDLARVSGIGESTVERLAPLVALARAGPDAADAADDRPLDPNRATAEELERLTGIGPVLARRIVAHRDSAGRFSTLADLERISGIGPRMLDRIRDAVRIRP